MWVARCPRCGFAVRWSPRAARGVVRAWGRLRALNNRFGIAVGAGHGAGILLAVLGSVLASNGDRLGELGPSAQGSRGTLFSGIVILSALCAVGAAASTVAIAPHRPLALRAFASWSVVVLPVPLLVLCAAILVNRRVVMSDLATLLRPDALSFTAITLAGTVAASVVLAAVLAPIQRQFARLARRRFRTRTTSLQAIT
jgi:hypothetical protein